MSGRNLVLAVIVACLAVFSCTKESIKTTYSNQEKYIETIVSNEVKADTTLRVEYKNGTSRIVFVEGPGTDSLAANGTVTFYYAGFEITSSRISTSTMFATNNADWAGEAKWEVSDSSVFEPVTIDLSSKDLVSGLKNGLRGVKPGEECLIMFSGKYGFGKKGLGTIPANSALAYYILVESISN